MRSEEHLKSRAIMGVPYPNATQAFLETEMWESHTFQNLADHTKGEEEGEMLSL